uniref:Putative secreted protein n=1 Tax=Ixodes ricinus TaxID=34613 RepID=A0A6B0UTF2_IXORI
MSNLFSIVVITLFTYPVDSACCRVTSIQARNTNTRMLAKYWSERGRNLKMPHSLRFGSTSSSSSARSLSPRSSPALAKSAVLLYVTSARWWWWWGSAMAEGSAKWRKSAAPPPAVVSASVDSDWASGGSVQWCAYRPMVV